MNVTGNKAVGGGQEASKGNAPLELIQHIELKKLSGMHKVSYLLVTLLAPMSSYNDFLTASMTR